METLGLSPLHPSMAHHHLLSNPLLLYYLVQVQTPAVTATDVESYRPKFLNLTSFTIPRISRFNAFWVLILEMVICMQRSGNLEGKLKSYVVKKKRRRRVSLKSTMKRKLEVHFIFSLFFLFLDVIYLGC